MAAFCSSNFVSGRHFPARLQRKGSKILRHLRSRRIPLVIDIRQEITAVIEATVLVVAALFPIVNPLGSAAIFVNLVGPDRFHHAAVAGAENRDLQLLSAALLPAVGSARTHILRYCDLRSTDWRRPGGRRYRMVSPEPGHGTSKNTATPEDQILENAFYPFTLPITVGPGSISVAITLGAHLPPELHEPSLFSPRVLIAAIAGITLICVIIYVCYSMRGRRSSFSADPEPRW